MQIKTYLIPQQTINLAAAPDCPIKHKVETHNLMKERVNNVKSSLAAHGILAKNITIDVISFVPRYEV
jgi:hypothetical protein